MCSRKKATERLLFLFDRELRRDESGYIEEVLFFDLRKFFVIVRVCA